MSKKHYEAIAKIIRDNQHCLVVDYSTNYEGWQDDMVTALADYFATQNPNFDRDKFIAACTSD